MAVIFLDVGAHEGQTLEEVVKHPWSRIYAFEPAPREIARLRSRFPGKNVTLIACALSDKDGFATLYGRNDLMEASLFPGHQDVDDTVQTHISTLDASSFFARRVHEPAVVKLNCEGGEIAILDRLIDTGQIEKIHALLVDFDARKIAGMEGEPARVKARLATIGFDRYQDWWPQGETHQDRVAAWLADVL